jgi:putative SOS response-associated peptidase YedK
MCGRFALFTPPARLARMFEATLGDEPDERAPSWNVAPTDPVLGIRDKRPKDAPDDAELVRVMTPYRWGLIPSWSKSTAGASRLCNARAETVVTRPSFRYAFESHRLVIPADGFYEWHKQGGKRQPHYFSRRDDAPMAFAGLWEAWRDTKLEDDPDAWIRSCTIITTRASVDLDGIHDRMPVILESDMIDAWLDPDNDDVHELRAMLRSSPQGTVQHHRVDPRVGNVRNNDAGLIDQFDPKAAKARADQEAAVEQPRLL